MRSARDQLSVLAFEVCTLVRQMGLRAPSPREWRLLHTGSASNLVA